MFNGNVICPSYGGYSNNSQQQQQQHHHHQQQQQPIQQMHHQQQFLVGDNVEGSVAALEVEDLVSGPMHAVRVHIPSYMQSAPMLAPGGGAEVLPAGLLDGSVVPPPGTNWYTNSGLAGFQNYIPISIHPNQQQTPQQAQTENIQQSTQSPFDYEDHPQTVPPSPVNQRSGASKALNLCISQGYINPANPISPSQLAAIGLPSSATTGSLGLNAPSSLGLPVYSASGFDLLSVMARVATRPDPKIALGPVDFTSSFVVVDVRRHDYPVIYVSPTFCRLTGYEEKEVVGRNCRFLQGPNGKQAKGEIRQYTSHDAVKHMKKNLAQDKECQTSIINYKKNGDAFINLVTVIPIRGGELGGDEDKVIYHVGFQVDLTEQPNAILQKLKDGTYIVNYTANNPVAVTPLNSLNRLFQQQAHRQLGGTIGAGNGLLGLGYNALTKDRKSHLIGQPIVSNLLRKLLDEPAFLQSFPVTTSTNADAMPIMDTTSMTQNAMDSTPTSNLSPPEDSSSGTPPSPTHSQGLASSPQTGLIIPNPTPHTSSANHPLSLILLEYTPDFLHVVSLKGEFQYVAPSVRRVLGYEPWELVGKSLQDICHPADWRPLTRELKDSSASVGIGGGDEGNTAEVQQLTVPLGEGHRPKSVDLLFRARTKDDRYVWVECRGRLHVEPGKGRKAILLSGRAKEMTGLKWDVVSRASGGLRGCDVVRKLVDAGKGKDAGVAAQEKSSAARRRKKRSGSAAVGADNSRALSDPGSPSLTTEEVEVKNEFWGTMSRQGILLIVTSGVRDVLGYDETELVGRQLDSLISGDDVKKAVIGELEGVGVCVKDGTEGVRRAACGLLKKGHQVANQGVAQVEIILYPSSLDYANNTSKQTVSPSNIIFQIRLQYPPSQDEIYPEHEDASIIAALGAGSVGHSTNEVPSGGFGSRAGAVGSTIPEGFRTEVVHPLPENIFQPLDVNRASSWQYELQQLKFANDRLKEEIKVIEAELEKKVSVIPQSIGRGYSSPVLSAMSPRTTTSTSSAMLAEPTVVTTLPMQHYGSGESNQSPQSPQHQRFMHFLSSSPTSAADSARGTEPSPSGNQCAGSSTHFSSSSSLISAYDHQQSIQSGRVTHVHHHQGMGSGVGEGVAYEAQHQTHLYGASSEYQAQNSQQRESISINGGYQPQQQGRGRKSVSMSIQMPPPTFSQAQAQAAVGDVNPHVRYQQHQPPASSSLKRSWTEMGCFDRGGGA